LLSKHDQDILLYSLIALSVQRFTQSLDNCMHYSFVEHNLPLKML